MEYGSAFSEEELIEELLVDGCWVESSGVVEHGSPPKTWWIEPSSTSSVKERLIVTISYLKECTNVVIQIWVPPLRRTLALHCHTNSNPNSTSNIRFYRCNDYSRLHYNVPGSLALPVFERGTTTCLGVLQILMQPILNTNSAFLEQDQGVDFGMSYCENLYEAAVNEMAEVLTCVCKTHNLPLALTWASCIQQPSKCGYAHSTTTDNNCVSTVDSACYVGDLHLLGFQEASSQCHLFRGQGIVGTAFTTTKPCFAVDVTAFTKAEYPLAEHAAMFGLHAAVAIPLRSVYTFTTTASPDFVLEIFLPKDCHDAQEQKHLLNSLSMLLQQTCRTLHVVMEDDFTFPSPSPPPPPPLGSHNINDVEACGKESSSSWIAHMMEAQHKGKGVCVSLEYLEDPKEEFKVTTSTHHHVFSEVAEESHTQNHNHTFGGRRSSSSVGRKPGEKRRTKAEKTISLPVLRQYFAGSLKDAAKSIGVCPTTLKRICRQHGITRWPSRKIKKVGHSLKKLQLVIDSVQGAEGAIQIGSFYTSFPELSSGPSQSSKSNNNNFYDGGGVGSLKSSASSGGIGNNQLGNSNTNSANGFVQQQHLPSSARPFRVKATFADEKIRFSLQPMWGIMDLQLEVARRFNLNDVSNMVVKYLDDDGEWVVLACDGDLEECKDLHRSSHNRTIRLALFQPNTLTSSSPS
ncbi:hypothetical protein RJT34_10617 [Clitoria ternatea]|uniref:Uncharacterized protein n=1 Tax=Clitoria ternatea TaxID=43366 RepID=A0AAN9JKB7_CLITE